MDYWAICGDSTNGAVPRNWIVDFDHYIAQVKEFRTTRVTGGGYKGIPNGLKQSRPGKLCVFTL